MWMDELFGVKKPIIALLHLRALPGDPLFGKEDSMESVLATAREELQLLQDGGVDGILIANEFSLPYEKKVSPVTVAAMGYIVGALKQEIRVPFGVNIVSNPLATIDLAAATGANFVRSTFTGAYMGEVVRAAIESVPKGQFEAAQAQKGPGTGRSEAAV